MALLLLLEIFVILFLRKRMAFYLVNTIHLLGGSTNLSVWIYSLISLPGVLSHEMSHFLYAAFLGLRTGTIELLPQLDSNGGVDLGSVQVEKKDPFRSSLVGIAPLLSGLLLVPWLSSLLPAVSFSLPTTAYDWMVIYLIMTITLHMTPSKNDMTSWPVVAFLLFLFISSFMILGFQIPQSDALMTKLNSIVSQSVYGVMGAIIFALIFIIIQFGIYRLVLAIKRRSMK